MSTQRAHELEALLADADWIRRLARSLTRDPQEAEDLAQQAWLTALRGGKSGRGWLRTVLRNLLWRKRRDEARRLERERVAARSPEEPDPADHLARMELQARLARALLELPEPYRGAVVLRHLDGLAHKEIANRQGISVEAARQRVSRGLAMLREQLDRERGRDGWMPGLLLLAQWAWPERLSNDILRQVALAGAAVGLATVCWRAYDAPAPPADDRTAWPAPAEPAPAGTAAVLSLAPREAARNEALPPQHSAPAAKSVHVTGVVIDPEGAPIEGALLELLLPIAPATFALPQGPRTVVSHASSLREGSFRIAAPEVGLFELRASAPGRARASLPIVQAGEDCSITLPLVSAFELFLIDAETGAPVPDALVELRGVFPDNAADPQKGLGDAFGRVLLEDLRPGSFQLLVSAPEHWLKAWLLVELEAGTRVRKTLPLQRGGTVHGRVIDVTTRMGIPQCAVSAGFSGPAVLTDENGFYRLGGIPRSAGGATIRVAPAGFGAWERRTGWPPPDDLELDFELVPSRSAHGRVVDADGAPVGEAKVVALSKSAAGAVEAVTATTRDDGTFLIENLRPELRHALHLEATGLASPLILFPEVELTQPRTDLGDVVLQQAGWISGIVVDLDGAPMAGFVVSRQLDEDKEAARGAYPHRFPTTTTDERGRFSFGQVPPGVHRLLAQKKGHRSNGMGGMTVEVAAGARLEEIVLCVDMAASVRGQVLDQEGRPAVGSIVRLFPAGSKLRHWDAEVSYTITDSKGRFTLSGLDEVEFQLFADRGFLMQRSHEPDWLVESPTVTVTPSRSDLTLVLGRGASLEGILLDEAGHPISGRKVLFFDHLQQEWTDLSTTTDASGRFEKVLPIEGVFILFVPHGLGQGQHLRVPGVRPGGEPMVLRVKS